MSKVNINCINLFCLYIFILFHFTKELKLYIKQTLTLSRYDYLIEISRFVTYSSGMFYLKATNQMHLANQILKGRSRVVTGATRGLECKHRIAVVR